jgi:hypothetical protein
MMNRRVTIPLAAALALGSCASDPGINPNSCNVQLAISSPAQAEAPVEISASASIQAGSSLQGFHQYTWQVWYDDQEPVSVEAVGQDGEIGRFIANRGGPYRVSVSAQVGDTSCGAADEVINIAAAGAPRAVYRLRLSPAPEQPAPPQERTLELPGGANYDLGDVELMLGVLVSGTVRDDALAPVAAYLRATAENPLPAQVREAFSDQSGEFQIRVLEGRYELLVVPEDNGHAPQRFASVATPWFALDLAPALPVAGSLSDSAGAAVADARVSLHVSEVPSTLGRSDPAGAFSVLARAGAPATLSVVPAQDSGRMSLSLTSAQGALLDDTASPIAIAYNDVVQSRALALEVRASDGASPVAGARVTLVARPVVDAGAVTLASGLVFGLTGDARISLTTGPDGRLAALVPEAVYDVIIEPGSGSTSDAVTPAVIDIRAGQPDVPALVLAAPAFIAGWVTDADGAPVNNTDARVSAVPVGFLAQVVSTRVGVAIDSSGRFSLPVSPDTAYQLVIDSGDGRHARERMTVTSPSSGLLELGTVALPRSLEVRGRATIPGQPGGAPGVVVQLLCADCQDADANWPLAEAISDSFGEFKLPVPDPAAP